MLAWLEETSLALWVGTSLWGYPIVLGMHVVGLSIAVGILMMLNLRILGLIKAVAFSAFSSLYKIAWIGLAINVVSGLALFSSQATYFVENKPFLVKISFIAIGVVLAILIKRELDSKSTDWDNGENLQSGHVGLLSIASVVCWIGAICAGRLIAYM